MTECTRRNRLVRYILFLNNITLYEEKHGKTLTKEEEKLLLEKSKGTKYQQIFALSLYTGLRPNELFTAKIDGNFIVAKNSKRKGKKVEYKKYRFP